jgi:hypothetical protein
VTAGDVIVYRAGSDREDEFWDPVRGTGYPHAVLRWDDGVAEGAELGPYETLATLAFGDVVLALDTRSFGVVRRLLVADGATVRPGQALAEVQERPPAMDEWERERDRALEAEGRLRDAGRRRTLPWGEP